MESNDAHLETLGDNTGLVGLRTRVLVMKSSDAHLKTLGDDTGLVALGPRESSEVYRC